MESPKITNCMLQFSSSSEDEELNNYHHLNLNSNNLLNSSLNKKPIPTPRTKNLPPTNQPSEHLATKSPNGSTHNSRQLLNQRNMIKNQQQVSDSTFTPQMLHKKLFVDKPNFVRTGSLDRKLQEVRKLNFSEMKLRLKQQQQQIEQNLLKKNMLKAKNQNYLDGNDLVESNKQPQEQLNEKCNGDNSNNLSNLNESFKSTLLNKPPTPPHHKGPLWENKFLKLAANSINHITSECTNRYTNNDEHWYLSSNSSLSNNLTNGDGNFKNDFLYINRLPFYRNLNQTIIRIDDANDEIDVPTNDVVDSTNKKCEIEDNHEYDDYDLPPDAYSNKSKRSIDQEFRQNDQLRQSKFIERQIEPVEKSGYLLCNKNKTFKQRYFVLKNNSIFYYKTQSDVKKNKLKGTIRLSKSVNVIRNENSSSFQIVESDSSSNLVYTLTADSVLTMEEWVRVIKNSLKSVVEQSQQDKKIDIESWAVRRKNGYSTKFWLILKERKLYFHKDTSAGKPVSCIDLNEYRVVESVLENSRNSLITNDLLGEYGKEYVISLENNCRECKENTSPVYLVFSNKRTFNDWLYYLTISTIENLSNLTDFEKIIYKLMSIPTINGDYTDLDSNPLWDDHLMIHSKDCPIQPLITLDTATLRNEAIKLFKSIQLFATVKIDVKSGIDYHCALAQSAFDTCFEHIPLQKELLCQLIKQSNAYSKVDSKSVHNFIQSFQLLSLAVSVFEPKGKILWLLKHFLRRKANSETETGRYAIYCQRCLDRCLTNGCREAKPSRLEVLAILLRNPYHHSLPFSIPVYFANENYLVISFDSRTTIEEFVKQICDQSELGKRAHASYGLYSDDPIEANKVHFLPWGCKLADVISRWESSLKNNNLGKFESKRVIKLIFKKRLFFRSNSKSESEKEKMLFVYQLNNDLLNNRIPIVNGSDIPIHLTALLLVLENGKMIDDDIIRKGIKKFYPNNLHKEQNQENLQSLVKFLVNQMSNSGRKDCIRIYLNCIKKWPIFGCNLFEAVILDSKRKVHLTVDEIYFYILDVDLKIISNYYLNKFLKFGHKENKLIIYLFNRIDCGSNSSREVIRSSFLNSSNSFSNNEKLEFEMDKDQLNELILLIADYLNVENSAKNERLTSESTNATTSHTSPFEFSPTTELPNSSLYDIKQFNSLKEDQEYSEIYSPSYEDKNHSIQPPCLPVHRCATWEKNLYELCVTNFNQFIECTQQHDLLFGHSKEEANQNAIKNRNSISSMISGEYYTNQLNSRDLSNEFSSLDVSNYSLSKSSLAKKSSNMSRCNSDNSSNSFLNEEKNILKESLLVLNKKMKWKKRIVLIRNFTIYYFKNESDLNKGKSKGKFKITSKTHLKEEDRAFKLFDNQQPSISITCDNQIKLKQCMTSILGLIENFNFKNVETLNSTIEGWIAVIKNGRCTRRWCKLKEKILFFYDESDDEAGLVLNLAEHDVDEAESNDYEFTDWTQSLNMERKREFSISIAPSDCPTDAVYLVFNEKKDFDVWFYHLSIASNRVIEFKSIDRQLQEKADKTFEQIISKLMKIEYEDGLIALESSYLWKETAICSIDESISQPLTTLKSSTLNSEAIKLYRSVFLFASVEIETKSHAIDYHIALAQGSIEMCLEFAELQNEFYCQIIKLSNNNSNKLMRIESNQENHLSLQAIQLLSIAVSIFIPKGKMLWFVKHFLRRQSDEHTNAGRYAIYCTKALERAMQTGNRELKPSRMEILGILLRNPYHHSLPHSIPVHFLNDKYLVVGFDGSTTIEEFGDCVRKETGLVSSKKGEYALYCDNPIVENHDHYLQTTIKVADIISEYEQCLRKKLGRFENNRILKLTLKKRQHFKCSKMENDKERLFLAYRICEEMREGKFPVNHDLAIQFLALLAQSEHGDLENHLNNHLDRLIETITTKFYPANLKSKVHSVFLLHDLKSKWMEIKNASSIDCIRVLINCAKKWSLFGSSLFKACSTNPIKVELTLSKYILPSNTVLWLAINENHISVLDYHNFQQICHFKLKNIVKFGGDQNKFALIVKKCNDEFDVIGDQSANTRFSPVREINYERFVLTMDRSQIFEFTLLIRDYLESDLCVR